MNNNVSRISRLGSALLDNISMTFIAMIFSIPWMIGNFAESFKDIDKVNPLPGQVPTVMNGWIYLSLLGFTLYLCKDSIKGRSIGKLAVGHQVVLASTGAVANPLRCMVRNLFLMIWPLEALVTLITPQRRLGDYIAGTKVIKYSYNPEKEVRPNFAKTISAVAITYVITLAIMMPWMLFINKGLGSAAKDTVVESSLNTTTANAIKEDIEAEYGNYLTAEVYVYDKMNNIDKKYVVVGIHTNTYDLTLDNDEFYEELKAKTFKHVPEHDAKFKFTTIYRSEMSYKKQSRTYYAD